MCGNRSNNIPFVIIAVFNTAAAVAVVVAIVVCIVDYDKYCMYVMCYVMWCVVNVNPVIDCKTHFGRLGRPKTKKQKRKKETQEEEEKEDEKQG